MDNERLDLQSPNLVNENVEKLAALFPNCVTESAEGKSIDFDLLRQELSHQVVEGTKERYRLEWPGKREAIVTANLPTTKTLRPVREDSVDFDNTENLYIEGDNLEVLKLLQESYLGKIKMIYIDPPYNTGKDFVYKDNFTQDSEEYKEESGQKDEYNQRLVVNPDTAGRYHSDWLSMMYPRLKLARNLLTQDGVIFISIDDNEMENLKKVGTEIFGEDNFVGDFIVRSTPNARNYGQVAKMHEYCLTFCKDVNHVKTYEIEELEKEFKFQDENGGFNTHPLYNSDESFHKGNRKNLYYPFYLDPKSIDKDGHLKIALEKDDVYSIEVYPPLSSKNQVQFVWRWSSDKSKENLNTEIVGYRNSDGTYRIVRKMRHTSKIIRSMFLDKAFSGRRGTAEVEELFSQKVFSFPKPVTLITTLLEMATADGDLVLDFFSGSASSAHGILLQNAIQKTARKFIMVQIPELTEPKSEAFKAGYKNLCEIGKERIRRAAKKIKEETGAAIDYGFRVYRLDESNMQDVYYKPQDYKQSNLDLFADNVKPDRTPDDLLAQVMLDWGLPLSYRIEQMKVDGKQVFKVAENSLYACFEEGIDEAFAKAIAKDKPLRVVFRDKGFKDDTAKVNVRQLLKQLSPETEMKVI